MQPAESKTIYLVRHAQSEQNVATHRLHSEGDLTAAATIINLGYDAPVSDEGRKQLDLARQKLETFANSRSITLVAHSPLQRAVATAHAIFQGRVDTMVIRPEMHERTVSEWAMPFLMDRRIDELRKWISSRDEPVIALVGHGQFFKRCLGLSRVMENVEVVQCSFNVGTGFQLCSSSSVFEGFKDPNHSASDEG